MGSENSVGPSNIYRLSRMYLANKDTKVAINIASIITSFGAAISKTNRCTVTFSIAVNKQNKKYKCAFFKVNH